MNDSTIQLILRQLLIILQNPATEDESLAVSLDTHSLTDPLLELLHSLVFINTVEHMILRIQSLDGDAPHDDDHLSTKFIQSMKSI